MSRQARPTIDKVFIGSAKARGTANLLEWRGWVFAETHKEHEVSDLLLKTNEFSFQPAGFVGFCLVNTELLSQFQ